MSFYEKHSMQGDCFWITRFMFGNVFHFKIVQLCLLGAIATQVFTYIFEGYVLYTHPEYFMQYAPLLFARTYGFGAAIAILIKGRDIDDVFGTLKLWALDSAGISFSRKSKRTVFKSNCFAFAIIVMNAVMLTVYLHPNKSDVDIYLTMFIIKHRYPDYSDVSNFFLKLLLTPIYYAMEVHCYLLAYEVQHIFLQYDMCIVKLEKIIEYCPEECEKLIDDDDFQKEINSRLVLIIKRLVHIVEHKRLVDKKLVDSLFVLLTCNGFIFGVAIMMMMYEYNLGAYTDCIQIKILCWGLLVQACAAFSQLIYYGQKMENAPEHLRLVITRMKWYSFDGRNRKNILMILLSMAIPMKFSFSTNTAVNYNLGLRMIRGLYSVLSLILSSRNYRQVD